MSYKKDQGRYARMAAFWALILLMAYGCIGGLDIWLRGMFTKWSPTLGQPWVEHFPLIGRLDLAVAVALGVLLIVGFVIYRWLNRPKIADTLIETEDELRKVTWPSASEVWNGSLAVMVTVVVLMLFLTLTDLAVVYLLNKVLGGGV